MRLAWIDKLYKKSKEDLLDITDNHENYKNNKAVGELLLNKMKIYYDQRISDLRKCIDFYINKVEKDEQKIKELKGYSQKIGVLILNETDLIKDKTTKLRMKGAV